MTCEPHVESLGEYVDGTLEPDRRARLEAHLAECESCRTLEADLRRIHDAAGTLPPLPAPDRVWTRIAATLQAERAAPAHGVRAGLVRLLRWFASPIPALATVVLAVTVGAAYYLARPGAPAPSVSNVADKELVQSVESELRMAEQHYEKAIAGLEQIAKAGQGNLDPQVAATLQKNLLVIDQAIKDSRQALVSQPGSQLAQESLFEAFKKKVALLQDTVTIINEIRKGNQAGAAQIVGQVGKS